MKYTRRDELNLISVRQQGVYGKEYVDEYGVVYVGNKKGKLERRSGASQDSVDQVAKDLSNYISTNPGTNTGTTPTTTTTDSLHQFLLMGG
jgi:hypothetical protein